MFNRARTGEPAATPAEGGLVFTEECRRALADARSETVRLGHSYVGTEHLLLALTTDPDGRAAHLLTVLGVDLTALREQTEAMAAAETPRTHPRTAQTDYPPFTGRAKKVIELMMREARDLGDSHVRPAHLLLALVAERQGIAARVLGLHGVTLERVRRAVQQGVASGASFRVTIDDASDRSIYEQIVERVQEAVATGRLQSGERLPPVRQLADDLEIAPGTVARAYAELERLGVVVTEGARGTRVAPRPRPVPAGDRPAVLTGLLRPVVVAAFHLGASASELRDALAAAMQDIFEPAAGGTPDGAAGGNSGMSARPQQPE